MNELKRRMAKGAAWLVLFRFVERGIGLVSTLILARILVPGDFGLIAMAMTIVAALELLGAYSFDIALIQNQKADRRHYDSAYTLGLIVAWAKALLMVALAIPAGQFYGEPRVQAVMLALAVSTAIQGFENIGIVAFQKDLEFHKEFKLGLIRRLAGFFTTVGLALLWESYWALVAGITVTRIVSVWLSYTMHPYRPRWCLEKAAELFHFSKWLLLNNVLIFLNTRGTDFIVGRISGTHALGLYTVSYELANLPTTELVHPISRAMFPGYARLADDPVQMRSTFVQVIGLLALLTVPAGLLVGALAELFVRAVLGAKWLESVPLISVLALFGVVRSLHGPTGSVFLALNLPRYLAWLQCLQIVVAVALMVVWMPRAGVLAAAWSMLVAGLSAMAISYWVLVHRLGLRWRALAAVVWRPLLSGAAMWTLLGQLAAAWDAAGSTWQTWLEFLSLSLLGVLVYLLLVGLMWRLSGSGPGAERQVMDELRRRLGRPVKDHNPPLDLVPTKERPTAES